MADRAMASSVDWAQPWEEWLPQCPPRYGTSRNYDRPTLGPRLTQTALGMGKQPMPWQRYVNDVAFEVDPDTGLLVYGTVVLSTPRQQGKTLEVVTVATHRCLAWPDQTVTYAAQTRDHARIKLQDDHIPMLERSDFAGRFDPIMTNGFERLKWENGSVWAIASTTLKSGHGPTLDLGIADESWAHPDGRIDQAWLPAMLTRPNSQLWVPSTVGESAAKSPYLFGKMEAGREAVEAGQQEDTAFFWWGAEPETDGDDPATWAAAMPAWGFTINERAVRRMKAGMKADAAKSGTDAEAEFERAGLNRWSDEEAAPSVVDLDRWKDCIDVESGHGRPIALAITASYDHKWYTITVAGPRPDGRQHWEVIEHRLGSAWVVKRAAELGRRPDVIGVGLDLAGPAGHLHLKLRGAGLLEWSPKMTRAQARGRLLTMPTAREWAQACGSAYDAIENDEVRWRGPEGSQLPLQRAVAGAKTRPLGDAFAWARRGHADIAPFEGVTLARWVLAQRLSVTDQEDYDAASSVY